MKHGTHCHCMMCTVGKKMGMIPKEQHHDHHADHLQGTCQHCGHIHSEHGSCDCGCK